MRYSLTLPLALAALATAPAIAQDTMAPTPPATTTNTVPPADTTMPTDADTTTTTAPMDSATPTDDATTPPSTTDAPATTEPVETAPPSEPVASPATSAPASATGAPANLTAEQKAAYDGWPVEAQTYFNGLTPDRQELFLRITDADKLKIVGLDAAQQEQVWASLEKQSAEQEADAAAPGN